MNKGIFRFTQKTFYVIEIIFFISLDVPGIFFFVLFYVILVDIGRRKKLKIIVFIRTSKTN